jgi:hypothetical protein
MNPIHAVCAFGLGALTMYYFDPQQGARRRALVRDQLVHARTVARREAEKKAKDLRNRARGAVAEATA